MIGFGIDLSGYTTGKTSVAAVEIEGQAAEATLLRGSALSEERKTGDGLKEVLSQEVAELRRCLRIGPVAVDIPIDLQGLPSPSNPTKVWELTQRPIDQKLRAMPPFADRIGAPVARFAAIMREGKFEDCLGHSLFETYPAETWRKLEIKAERYKGSKGKEACALLCKILRIDPPATIDDDIDAIICAITAAAPLKDICGGSDFGSLDGPMPKGFRILKIRRFDGISVTTANFNEWMDARERSL